MFEAFLIAVTVYYAYGPGNSGRVPPTVPPGTQGDCNEWVYTCSVSVSRSLQLPCSELSMLPGQHARLPTSPGSSRRRACMRVLQGAQAWLIAGMVACSYVYFGLYLYYISCAWSALRGQPYCKFKCGAALLMHTSHLAACRRHACAPVVADSSCQMPCTAARRMGNLIVRLHLRLRILVVVFFMLSIVLLWFVRINTCRSYIETWTGAPA